jgi:WD40 repeat protein
MTSEHGEKARGQGRIPIGHAVRELAEAAVDGLDVPDNRLSGGQRQRAHGLVERIASAVHQELELELRRSRRHEPALRDVLAATTTLFQEHPLTAGELVALDLDPARAADALVARGEPSLAAIEPSVATWCRDRIVPRVVQQLLSDHSLIAELASSAGEAGQQTMFSLLLTLEGHDGAVASAVFSPTGGAILTASEDTTARLWCAATGQQQTSLEGHEAPLWRAAYSLDGGRIATASHDWTARLWDAANGQQLLTIRGHEDWVRTAVLSGDGTKVLTASYDATARLWDAASGSQLLTLAHDERVADAAFSPGDGRIVTACYDAAARIWDALTGQQQLILQGHEREVVSAAFNHAGTKVVTASHDLTARIWDAASGELLVILQGHTGQVRSAVFSPDDSIVLTASDDRTARLWHTVSGQPLATLEGHTDWVFSAAFSPNGTIVTASSDRTAKVWQFAIPEASRVMIGRSGRMPIPSGFRTALGIEPGDLVTVELWQGELRVRPAGRTYPL